jgi:hypothetical protein
MNKLFFSAVVLTLSACASTGARKPSSVVNVPLGSSQSIQPGDVAIVQVGNATTAISCQGEAPLPPPQQPMVISAQRSESPMMQFQCKDQRGIASSAVEKELAQETLDALSEFTNKCRAQGGGRLCFGPTFDFHYEGNPQQFGTTGTCTVTVSVTIQ